jgi:hypothetical protein
MEKAGIHSDHPDLDLIGNGFVSVGDVRAVGPDRDPAVRLVNGTELVRPIFEHYEQFNPEWKCLLPMVYVVDREP